jgi:hypothetical protein
VGFYFELEVSQSWDPLEREKVPLDKERVLLILLPKTWFYRGVEVVI